MTLQNLNKILDRYESQVGFTCSSNQFELLQGSPFYCQWEQSGTVIRAKHAQCCFNHAIGLPLKNGQSMPLFNYEQLLFNEMQSYKHVWIKKATGLGVTEFMLRYMAWLCISTNKVENSQMCIVTGPRIELAITLIDRMKELLRNYSSLSVYRFWRDLGFVFGAVGIGFIADSFNLNIAIQRVAWISLGSGIFVLLVMQETRMIGNTTRKKEHQDLA